MDGNQETAAPPVDQDLQVMRVQDVEPPEWRAVLNLSHDLGYPDFFPSRPGFRQPEDVVTGVNVRQGFQGVNVVAAGVESVSVHAAISDRLKKQTIFRNVDALAMEILDARRDKAPKLPESSYKLPSRVVYNETMKKSFLNDLSDERIPLNSPKFAKSVPHGMKGVDLLEMLWTRRIKVDRAVWLVQTLGAHEVQNLRKGYDAAKNPFSPNQQYSITFTEALTTYMGKQMGDLGAIHQRASTDRIVATQEDTTRKQLWIDKWDYTQVALPQELLEELLFRQLLDARSFGMWIRDSVQSVRLPQLPFVLDLLERVVSLLYEDRMVGTCVVGAALVKLHTVVEHPVRDALQSIEQRLVQLIKSAWVRDVRMFLFPQHWRDQEMLLRSTLALSTPDDLRAFLSVRARNLRLLCHRIQPKLGVSQLEEAQHAALAGLKHLDNYDGGTGLHQLCSTFFAQSNGDAMSSDALRGKLAVLLDWGVKRYHIQPHRPYLAAALVKHMLSLSFLQKALVGDWFEPHLMSWVDKASQTTERNIALAMKALSSELFNNAVLKFDVYLQRMIALGRTYRQSSPGKSVNKYLGFLVRLQIINLPPSTVTLREHITHGFQENPRTSLQGNTIIREALDQYLNQSTGIHDARNLSTCTLSKVPAILLEVTPGLLAECRNRLTEFSPSASMASTLEHAVRMSLFIHLLEQQRNYRLLLDLLASCLNHAVSPPKPVADAIKRHRLLISCFQEQIPALRIHATESPYSWYGGPVLLAQPELLQRQIHGMEKDVSMIDQETLDKLYVAHRSRLTADSVSTLWTISLQMVSRFHARTASSNMTSVIADLWTGISQYSSKAWKTYLRAWAIDMNPVSSIYAATSALSLGLLLRGAMEASVIWNKLVYPFIGSAVQVNVNRLYLQPVASLCTRLLPTVEPIGTAHDLLMTSAITSDFAKMPFDSDGALSGYVQRLPSLLLLLLDENSPTGISLTVRDFVTSPYLQSIAVRHELKVKNSFSTAISEVPERRAFFVTLLNLILEQPEVDAAVGIVSNDWRSLVSGDASQGIGLNGGADLDHLSSSQAKTVVAAAAQLLFNGSISTWWRMCSTMPVAELSAINVATCTLIADCLCLEATTPDVLRQLECYLSVMEIARSSVYSLAKSAPITPVANSGDVLHQLLSQLERQASSQLPDELIVRLLALITSVMCLITAISDIQLRLLQYMDSCTRLPVAFAADLAVAHFQIVRPDKRPQLMIWLKGSRLNKTAEVREMLKPALTNDCGWEILPVISDNHGSLPHRLSFTRLTAPANNGALSLLRFGAVLTGDRVISPDPMEMDDEKNVEPTSWSRLVTERDVGINPTGDSFYLRNLASGLSILDEGGADRQSDVAVGGTGQDVDIVTERTSPAELAGTATDMAPSPSRPQPRKRAKVAFEEK